MGLGFRSFHVILAIVFFSVVGCTSNDSSDNPQNKAFENPGGMWMPTQMGAHADTLRNLGIEFDPAALTDPLAHPLGAIVWLGNCSASFVSQTGLIITNHHCIQGALQHNSSSGNNLIENGYLARTLADELPAGPGAHVFVTTAFTDVTDIVLKDIEQIAGDEAKYREIQKRRKELTQACEAGKTDVRCLVPSFFEGAQFFQIEQLQIRDVRLVYSPHQGVGFFGGFDDNWRWPRQAGDYGFLRAYVGPDGKPAEYSPQNVPYRPAHALRMPSRALGAGDLVMVAGYPGTTSRFRTADEVGDDIHYDLPRRISLNTGYLDLLEGLAEQNEEYKEKTHTLRFSLENSKQFYAGSLDGLKSGNLYGQKVATESRLKKWIAEDDERALKYGDVFIKMDEKRAKYLLTRNRDQAFVEILGRSATPELRTFGGMNLLKAAYVIVRKAAEREKPDAERMADFQQRNWERLVQDQVSFQKMYAREVERRSMRFFLERAGAMPVEERPLLYEWIVGSDGIEAGLDRLYEAPELAIEDEATRLAMLDQTLAEIEQSTDPMIRLARKVLPEVEALEKRLGEYQGGLAAIRPRYIEALVTFQGGLLAPDANSTLRITYGTVRGYRPSPGADVFNPFTGIASMLEKHTGIAPFNAPENLVAKATAALASGDFGPYKAQALGTLPVDFLADLDITGGNSGSATLNSRGEIVGLAFDGNIEAMASNWVFMPEITRSIHVDIRYVLWIMDAVDGADRLLLEMGVTPQL